MAKKRTKKQRSGKREKQRHPFRKETRMIELLQSNSYRDLKSHLQQLKPYLLDKNSNFLAVNQLYFDLQKIVGVREYIYAELRLFFKRVREKDGLRCRQSYFFRYLADPEHCNLGIKESSIKTILNQYVILDN